MNMKTDQEIFSILPELSRRLSLNGTKNWEQACQQINESIGLDRIAIIDGSSTLAAAGQAPNPSAERYTAFISGDWSLQGESSSPLRESERIAITTLAIAIGLSSEPSGHTKRVKPGLRIDDLQPGIIGKSQAMADVITMTDRVAATAATVLIQGESGTGKELIAKRLHQRSERSSGPFVTVNCGALQEALLESELFGHERGAFTGAVNLKSGLAEVANGGTLFLDEVGELSPGIQAKLLRFLQEGEFYRVGGKQPLKVDVRIISATNRDLQTEVHQGRFREDLFYRLNTISIKVPALRNRSEDVPTLAEHFLRMSKLGGQTIRQVEPGVYEALKAYSWPGNIRELQNTIERMKILSDGQTIKLSDIPVEISQPRSAKPDVGNWNAGTPLDDVERDHILRSLSHFDGNKTRTAQSLKITIKTLYNKLHRYGVLTPSKLGESSHVQAQVQEGHQNSQAES